MAIHPIIHKETGETKVIEMSVHDITEWYQNNPEWKRDWPSGCASSVQGLHYLTAAAALNIWLRTFPSM